MDWNRSVLFLAAIALSVGASAAQTTPPGLRAMDTGSCFIDHAARNGDAVKVVFVKGVEPQGVVIRADGSKTFFNGEYIEKVKSRHEAVLRNPRSSVTLHEGDKLGIIGMDDGMLELKIQWGLPSLHIPGVKQHVHTTFIPVAAGE